MSEPDEKKNPERFKLGPLMRVLGFLAPYPIPVALSLGLLLVNLAIEMALPRILGDSINNLRWHASWGAAYAPSVYVKLYLSLVLVRTGCGIVLGPIRNRLVQRTLGDLRSAIYDAIQRHAFAYHDKSRAGELISRATTDVWRLQDFLFACLFLTIDIGAAIVVSTWLILSSDGWLGAATIATMVPTLVLIGVFASHLQPQWRKVHDLHSAMTTVVQENIAGVRVVKAFAREEAEIAKFRDKRQSFLETLNATVNYWASRVPMAQFVFGLSFPLILAVGGSRVISGALQLGDLAAALLYLMAIGHRMGQVGQLTNIVQNASASAERIMEILLEQPRLRSGKRELPVGRGAIAFDQVVFRYGTQAPSLSDVTFEAKPGQTVAIVGPTGAGKSTLVHLLPRFYDVDAGQVRFEGVDVRELRLDQLRQNIGMVFQESFLFSATVAENISYGRPEASRDEVVAAASAAQAHDFIVGLENGYDTLVGERGVNLSGGQKQRLAIARAFLLNPRVMIMDDATASVDPHTERLIQEGMRRLSSGRTTLVIAHRLSTVRSADFVLVLNGGKVVEQGKHEELLRRGGYYAQFFAEQLLH